MKKTSKNTYKLAQMNNLSKFTNKRRRNLSEWNTSFKNSQKMNQQFKSSLIVRTKSMLAQLQNLNKRKLHLNLLYSI